MAALTPDELAILGHSFLFRGIEGLDVLLAGRGTRRHFAPGEAIFGRDSHPQAIGILLSGSAVVMGLDGVLLNRLAAGSLFGVASIFSGGADYVQDVIAEREAEILFLSEAELDALFQRCYPVCRNYIAFLAGRIRFLNDKIDRFTAPDTESRLLGYLRARATGDPPILEARSITELARVLHIGRASLYRALDTLEAQGALVRQGRRILLTADRPEPPDG